MDVGLGDNVLMPTWEVDKIKRTKSENEIHILEENFEDEKKKS